MRRRRLVIHPQRHAIPLARLVFCRLAVIHRYQDQILVPVQLSPIVWALGSTTYRWAIAIPPLIGCVTSKQKQ